jgi:arginyl-tRNA synthetase
MYFLEKFKKEIIDQINKAIGEIKVKPSDLVYPPKPEMGNLSLPCFKNGIKPGEIPTDVFDLPYLASVKWTGPYLNFTFKEDFLAAGVLKEINRTGENYGLNKNKKSERVMIEFSNVNTHKEYHVGHLRNICYGDAVNRILSANGHTVFPVSYINDFGIHVAKTLWAYLEFYGAKEPKEKKGQFLGQVYVRASAELKNKEHYGRMVLFYMKKIEGRRGAEYKLWQKTRQWSIKQFAEIYKDLGIKFAHTFYESEFVDQGKILVDDLLKKGVLTKSEGAVIADLNKDNLGVLVFLRTDGTALYPVSDLPLALEKIKKYRLHRSLYVVDIRQALYFKQLFKLLEHLGHTEKLAHLAHEFVKLPEGMMASRTGNVITYEELREKLFAEAVKETKERHPDWSEPKIEDVAKKLTVGAMKFEMVKVSREQVITFDIKAALRFDGFTAAYLQYTYARINSILQKSKIKNQKSKIDYSKLVEQKEHNIILKLAQYPEAVKAAGEKYDPSEIAKYLFDLAREFNDYYHAVPVLKAEVETRLARLNLIAAVNQVLENGLGLLGIETLKEM